MKKYKPLLVALLIIAILVMMISGCEKENSQVFSTNNRIETLLVFSGAGLKKPMDEIGKEFKKKYGIEIQYSYAGSAQNLSQIEFYSNGDVYVPGSMYYYEVAKEKDLVDIKKDVAYHIPIIVVPKGNPKKIKGLSDLSKPGLKVVLGDQKISAIGKVSMKLLEQKEIKEDVIKNLIASTATVNELIVYMTMGQADASIVWEDNAKVMTQIEIINIPKKENIIKKIPICRIKSSSKKEIADKFIDFVVSSEGKSIFKKHGFKVID